MANSNPLPPPEEHQFKPGESGNPEGRPKGVKNMSTILREFLELETEVDGVKMTYKDSIVKKLIKSADNSDLRAIQEIFDRTEGKAKIQIMHGGLPKAFINLDPLDDKTDQCPTEDSPA